MTQTSLFQFHKGTIKTTMAENSKTTRTVFQFHKGTIKTRVLFRQQRLCSISIP